MTYVSGVKPEGDNPPTFATVAEAWGVFIETVAPVLADADVVEWRVLPQENRSEGSSGRFYVRARLSAYKAAN